MIIEPIEFKLKDGRKPQFAAQGRGQPRHAGLSYQSAGETEFIVRYPEECGRYTIEYETALFEKNQWIRKPSHARMLC